MTGRLKEFIFFRIINSEPLTNYLFDRFNGKTLIWQLAILCGIHMAHRFNMLCINTTWGELSSMGQVVF